MDRREFLAVCASAPLLRAATGYRLACATLTWPTDRFDEALDACAEIGYAGVHYRSPEYDRFKDRPAELKEKLAKLKLAPVCLSAGSVDARPSEREKFIERTLEQARFQKIIGGEYVQLLDNFSRSQGIPEPHQKLAELLNEIGKRTADVGVRLGYHNHMNSLSETPDGCKRLFDALDARYVGLILDTAHAARGGSDPVEMFKVYGGRLLFPHLKDLYNGPPKKIVDFDGRTRDQWFTALGLGSIDLAAVVAQMKKHGYKGWVVTELDVYDRTQFSEKEGVSKNFKYCRERLGL
jgi:inosose dehydratase